MAANIESNKVIINASQGDVYSYLIDFNNIKELLPQDKISDWDSSVDHCSFKIQNAAVIPLIKDTVEPESKINIKSGDKAPFTFTLEVFVNEKTDSTCEAYFLFEGDINAFLKMMVIKPLTNLFNYMATRIQEVHS